MITIPKSTRHSSDETLFFRAKQGHELSYNALYQRYYPLRYSIASEAAPSLFPFCDDFIIHDAFTTAFFATFDAYKPGRAKFKTYFARVFGNAIIDEVRQTYGDCGLAVERGKLSLDKLLYNRVRMDESGLTLHDVIPDNDWRNDPVATLHYNEAMERYHHPPSYLSKKCHEIATKVQQEGYSTSGTARRMSMPRPKAKHLINRHNKWAKKALEDHR